MVDAEWPRHGVLGQKWIKVGLNRLDGGKSSHKASEREREVNLRRGEEGIKQETPL